VRRLVIGLGLLAAACGGSAQNGPAWPKSAGTEIDPDDDPKDDGGESIDPRLPGSVASVEASTEPAPPAEATPAATDTPAPPAADQPATPPTPDVPVPVEPVLEEIIIEVKPD
jgi:hypothetical protein